MVRYTKKNLTDPVFEFENDYIIEEVDAHVPISGTNKTVRIVSDKGNKTNPNANPLSGTNMELIENALVDLNKLDVDHNITINPVNTYFTDSEVFNYMITNGYKSIKVSGADVRFHPDLGSGILTFSIGDTKYSTMYESNEDELRKRTIGTLTGLTLDNNYLHIVNTADVDGKLETVYETIGLTNDRVDQLFETTNAYLESSSVEAPSNVVWTTVEQKLNIKTAPRTHVSNAAKLAFDDTLAYTFNCIENGAYNVSPLFSVSNTAGVARTLTVKLYRYVDGVTDTLIQTWPAMIIDRENDTFAPLTYQFSKGIVGTEKYYITFVTDGAGVVSNGFLLNVGLVIDDQVVPASVTTDQVFSKGVTGYPDNSTSTTIFNALNTKTQNQTADVNGTTFSNGVSWNNATASNPVDTSNHITLYGSGTSSFGISVSSGAQNYIVRDGNNSHSFYAGGTLAGKVKHAIDEPKSLITKEYAESNFQQGMGGTQHIDLPAYTDSLGRITFSEPIDIYDIVKLEISGTYTTDAGTGPKGVGIRPNGSVGPYAVQSYSVYGANSTVETIYENATANIMLMAMSKSTNSDQSFMVSIVPNSSEWTLRSHSWNQTTNAVWDAPPLTLTHIDFLRYNSGTVSWFEFTLSIYTKSGKQFGYVFEPVPTILNDLEIIQPDVDPEVSN